MGVFTIKRKDGSKAWYYSFMYNGVRYRKLGGSTKTQALLAMEKVRNSVFNEDYGLVEKVKNPRIEDFAKTFLERRKHIRSFKRDELSVRILLRYFRGKTMSSISSASIEDYIHYRKASGVSNSTINRELACLKRMYNLAIRWKEVRINPVTEIDFLEEPPGRTRFLSLKEAKRLIEKASEPIKPIIITALNTGMRLGEILSLRWSQVHIENMTDPAIEIIESKNNKKRFVPLNEDMIKLFNNIRSKNDSDHVFIGERGRPLRSIRNTFNLAMDRADIKDFRFHDLRHTFASHYLMSGGELLSLREILGHSDLKMVQRYAHLASKYKREMINNLSSKFY
jgi:integrase